MPKQSVNRCRRFAREQGGGLGSQVRKERTEGGGGKLAREEEKNAEQRAGSAATRRRCPGVDDEKKREERAWRRRHAPLGPNVTAARPPRRSAYNLPAVPTDCRQTYQRPVDHPSPALTNCPLGPPNSIPSTPIEISTPFLHNNFSSTLSSENKWASAYAQLQPRESEHLVVDDIESTQMVTHGLKRARIRGFIGAAERARKR
uniref:Uncharacterized protein n=1 Tax=Plectus sambesii TaxID=2011161 RepID=A0A914WQ64_9BILA